MKKSQLLVAMIVMLVAVLTAIGSTPAAAQDGDVRPSAPAGPDVAVTVSGLAQIAALQQEKETRTPAQQKMSSALLMALRRWRQEPLFDLLPEFQTLPPDADGRILVDVDLAGPESLAPVLAQLGAMNAEIVFESAILRAVRARMPLAETEALAAMPEVTYLRDADGATVNGRASALNRAEGFETHLVEPVHRLYGITGAGQKICVLSDGVDSLTAAQATGDLPPNVMVLAGQAGAGDEGTAMLEIIHDLAPGAELGFATGFNGVAGFAQNILGLKAAGCTIIVDDISYFVESPFQDNTIAQAVITVTEAGVLFFSSAANDGNLDSSRSGTWEGDFNPNGTLGALPGGMAHNFGDGGKSNLLTSDVQNVMLHWADPFGASANDYDLYVMNGALSAVLGASTNLQDGNDIPYEIVQGFYSAGARIVVLRRNGAAGRMINLLAGRSTLANATAGATRGHSAAPLAYSVAAVPAHVASAGGGPTGPYPNPFTTADAVEWFSSDGPRRIFFAADGTLLPGAPAGNFSASGGVVRQKPDISAADGVATSAPGFDPFFGTSAAAPHAAAIAGLLKEAFPLSSTQEIRNLFALTTLDIMAPGVDRNAGHGIVMPLAALQAAGASFRAHLQEAEVNGAEVLGNGDAYLDPNETWAFTIPLSNTGGATATAVSAVLTSNTPGVTILTGTADYPNLPAATEEDNDSAFVLQAPPEAECGSAIALTLTVTYQDGGARTMALRYVLPVGQMSITPAVFSYAGPAVPIPDVASPPLTATVPLAVSGLPGRLGRLRFSIDGTACTTTTGATTVGVDHSYVSDLAFDLVAPDGTRARLIDNVGDNGVNFCQTVLDDLAVTQIQTVTAELAPFAGLFRPAQPLATFNTASPNGTWQLRVVDGGLGDTGSVRAFSLQLWPMVCQPSERLAALALDAGTLTPAFAPATRSYMAQLGPDAQSLILTPTARSGVTITVNGVDAPGGTPLGLPLPLGTHPRITVELASPASTALNAYTIEVNRAPLAGGGTWGTQQDTLVSFNVMTATSDLDGDSLQLTAVMPTANTHGTVAGTNAAGDVTYTPQPGYTGVAEFEYTVEDGHGGSSSATGRIIVTASTTSLYLPAVLRETSSREKMASPSALP